jgi:hypothetical protein
MLHGCGFGARAAAADDEAGAGAPDLPLSAARPDDRPAEPGLGGRCGGAGELAALVGVEDLGPAEARQRLLEGRDDITYVPIGRGFLYLVAVMDWASRAPQSPSAASAAAPACG